MTLHDELRELVDTFGQGLLGDADQFRAALDDYLPENAALPGQLNVLYDAIRFGAYERCVELLSQGSDPMLAVGTAGDRLARDRGTTEVVTSRWAVATLAHATGHLATAALSVFLQPDTAGGSPRDPAPSVPTPAGPAPGSPPPGPPPSYPPTAPPPTAPPPTAPPPTATPPLSGLPPPVPSPSVPPPTEAPPAPPPAYLPREEQEAPASGPDSWRAPVGPAESGSASTTVPPPTGAQSLPKEPVRTSSVPAPPLTVTAPGGASAASPPPPPGSGHDEGRKRSKAWLAAVAAVAVVAAAGVGTYLVLADGDEPKQTATDSGPSDPPSSPPTSPPTTTPPAPLTAPAMPKLKAAPAYRSVAFTVSGPVLDDEGVVLEVASDDGWTATEPRFTIPTDEGGQKACARVRGVRTDGDRTAPGPAARMCAESKPRTVRLTRSNAECPDHIPESSFVCYVYDLSVAGFKPDRKATRRIIGATYGGISQPCAARCVRSFPVDSDGRGRLDGALYAFGGQRVTIDVDGVRTAVDVG